MSELPSDRRLNLPEFPPDVREYVDHTLATGKFSSEEELIIAALYSLRDSLANEGRGKGA